MGIWNISRSLQSYPGKNLRILSEISSVMRIMAGWGLKAMGGQIEKMVGQFEYSLFYVFCGRTGMILWLWLCTGEPIWNRTHCHMQTWQRILFQKVLMVTVKKLFPSRFTTLVPFLFGIHQPMRVQELQYHSTFQQETGTQWYKHPVS